jgi:hypothetical protein
MRALSRLGRLFPRNDSAEVVATKVHFDVPPEAVWRGMVFYEEVPRRPTPLLRMFLPTPVRTRGEKTRLGALIECTYEGGYLEKRITAVEPARFVQFEILVQQLGIEECISMDGGSYEIRAEGTAGSEVVLSTLYRGHLRPRWLWRFLERFLAHGLHNHILDGMRVMLETTPSTASTAAPLGEEALSSAR